MPTLTTLKTLDLDTADELARSGGAFVDLRPIDAYLDVHIPGSLPLLYEKGPGMGARARDCVPLDVELVLCGTPELSDGALANAAASLRGKGFTVAGMLDDAVNAWARVKGSPGSTDVVDSSEPPSGVILHVGDPGAANAPDALAIPVEKLWARVEEVPRGAVAIAAGYGVRAALAVGILEHHGWSDIALWRPSR